MATPQDKMHETSVEPPGDRRAFVLDAVGHSIADALATLESPTDGLGKPMTPLTHTELVSAKTALRLVLVHLGALKYEITQIEIQRLHRLAGL